MYKKALNLWTLQDWETSDKLQYDYDVSLYAIELTAT